MKKTIQIISLFSLVFVLGGCSYKIVQTYDTTAPAPQIINQTPNAIIGQSPSIQSPQTPSIDLKSKCATDGDVFVQKYQQTQNITNGSNYKLVWSDPQYHYNAKMNTCLAAIFYVQEVNESGLGTSNYTINLIAYSLVFDVYSNQAVLQSINNRVNKSTGNTDTLAEYPSYQNIPNLDENTYNDQLKVLMSE